MMRVQRKMVRQVGTESKIMTLYKCPGEKVPDNEEFKGRRATRAEN